MKSLSEYMSARVSDNIYEEEKSFMMSKKWQYLSTAELSKIDHNSKVIVLCHQSDLLFGQCQQYIDKFFVGSSKNSLVFIEKFPENFVNEKTVKKVLRM